MKRGILVSFIAISFVGFLDAAFLAMEHFLNRIPPCGISGCETVTTSVYSSIFGIPVALLGAIYYFLMFIGTIYAWQKNNSSFFKFLNRATWIGFIASIWFVSAQIFIIHSLCLYCLFSALTSTGLFILGMVNLRNAPDLRA
jgi:uncharacterized membrane protein